MVSIDSTGIHWTSEFGRKYQGVSAYERLLQYIKELSSDLV